MDMMTVSLSRHRVAVLDFVTVITVHVAAPERVRRPQPGVVSARQAAGWAGPVHLSHWHCFWPLLLWVSPRPPVLVGILIF